MPMNLVPFCLDRSRGVGIKLQDVVAQFRRREIEFLLGQLAQQLCIGLIGERVFRRLGGLAAIKIAVGKHEFVVCALLPEKGDTGRR